MNILKTTLFAVSAALLFQSNAFSQANMPKNDTSTGALVALCKDFNDVDAQNFCFGFGEGVYQAYLANLNPAKNPAICFTSGSTTREMILQEFLAWNQANPQFNQERAAKSLVRFFQAKYPCK